MKKKVSLKKCYSNSSSCYSVGEMGMRSENEKEKWNMVKPSLAQKPWGLHPWTGV